MTTTELLALARAATPGPWRQIDRCASTSTDEACGITSDHLDRLGHLRGVFRSDAYDECSHPVSASDAAYIAAASPDVIAALCERVEALEAQSRKLIEQWDEWGRGTQEHDRKMETELDALRALVERTP